MPASAHSAAVNYSQNEYTLTVTSAHGTVTKNPDQATYHYGDVVQLTAVADAGWTFANWSGSLTGSDNPGSITIDANETVTANYTQNEYTLTVNVVGNGSVAKDPSQATYHYDDVVDLNANPDPGWQFVSWSGDLTGSTNPDSITIDGNKSVTATFEVPTALEYTVTITVIGNGEVQISPQQTTYHVGDAIQLTAVPGFSGFFVGWSGDVLGTELVKDITCTGDMYVTATFSSQSIFLPIVANGDDSSSPLARLPH
jgi:uncharacterized repeat protein (TIGR02543 family)